MGYEMPAKQLTSQPATCYLLLSVLCTVYFSGCWLVGGHKEMSSILADQQRPMSPNAGGGPGGEVAGSQPMITAAHTWSPNKIWRSGSNSIFNLCRFESPRLSQGILYDVLAGLKKRHAGHSQCCARYHFTGPKKLENSRAHPLLLPLVMDMHASKILCMGLYKSQVHKQLFSSQKTLAKTIHKLFCQCFSFKLWDITTKRSILLSILKKVIG